MKQTDVEKTTGRDPQTRSASVRPHPLVFLCPGLAVAPAVALLYTIKALNLLLQERLESCGFLKKSWHLVFSCKSLHGATKLILFLLGSAPHTIAHILISNQPCFVKVTAVLQSDKSVWLLCKLSITFWLSPSQEAISSSELSSLPHWLSSSPMCEPVRTHLFDFSPQPHPLRANVVERFDCHGELMAHCSNRTGPCEDKMAPAAQQEGQEPEKKILCISSAAGDPLRVSQ